MDRYNNSIYQEIERRQIKYLCHFTPQNNLEHIKKKNKLILNPNQEHVILDKIIMKTICIKAE